MTKKEEKRGPKPETVKIDGDWEDAVKTALDKKRPREGWPDHVDSAKSEKENDNGKEDRGTKTP